ncbi:hypothetical protein F0L68_41225, partial [Solihabitans fulvus]
MRQRSAFEYPAHQVAAGGHGDVPQDRPADALLDQEPVDRVQLVVLVGGGQQFLEGWVEHQQRLHPAAVGGQGGLGRAGAAGQVPALGAHDQIDAVEQRVALDQRG